MAARISAEGRVNVSLRNSTAPATGRARFSSITTSVLVSVATLPSPPHLCALSVLCGEIFILGLSLFDSLTLLLFHARTLLLHQFHKHFVRHAYPTRRQSHQAPLPLNQSSRSQSFKSRVQRNTILSFNSRNI